MDVAIADVVTQPYDKITPAMQQAYYSRSPYNLVRIILGLPELFDVPGENDVYTRAANHLAEWRRQGVLYRENEPCIFAYRQRFTVPRTEPGTGTVKERQGFIALGELQDYSSGVVFRHEQTLTQPRTDRMHLLQATRAHFGPIFMLYSDPALTVERTLFGANFRAEIELTDEFGVEHQLARISDPNTINILASAMADKKLIIADGHHRYETALQYSREQAPASIPHQERNLSNSLPAPPFPEAAVLMTFVNMDAEGLTILPTHRVVHGLEDFNAVDFIKRAETFFAIERMGETDTAKMLQTLAATTGTAFIAATQAGSFLMKARPDAISNVLASLPERQRKLDVVQLHAVVVERLLGIDAKAIVEQRNLRYIRDAQEALEQVANGSANLALLMNPCTLEQLQEIAFAGDVMPQKSTDFYPKLLSGLAIYALD
jgi:uncharacterized protein (DUF1015 family)